MSEPPERRRDMTPTIADPDPTGKSEHGPTAITSNPETKMSAAETDIATLDDDQLISKRAALRTRIGQLPWHDVQRMALADQYEELTVEFDRRARAAWRQAAPRADSASTD